MGIALLLLLLSGEPKQLFIRVSSNIIKLCKIWKIQLLIIPCAAFRGQKRISKVTKLSGYQVKLGNLVTLSDFNIVAL